MFRTVRNRPFSWPRSSREARPHRRPGRGPPEGWPPGTRARQRNCPGGRLDRDSGMRLPRRVIVAGPAAGEGRHHGGGDPERGRRAAVHGRPAGVLPQRRRQRPHRQLHLDQDRAEGPAGREGGRRVRRLLRHVLRAGPGAEPGQGERGQEQPEPGGRVGRLRRSAEHDGSARPAEVRHRQPEEPRGEDGRDGARRGHAAQRAEPLQPGHRRHPDGAPRRQRQPRGASPGRRFPHRRC